MRSHLETGREGELLAANWILQRGFQILERNWRHRRYEVDIIALKNDTLHIIEVKTKRTGKFGHPEAMAFPKKLGHLIEAVGVYMEIHQEWTKICFDILAIKIERDNVVEVFWIEDVYP